MRVIMSCAGTGGHIYPAIAIADRIKAAEPDSEIMFIGTREGMENRLVKAAGYEIQGIDASGFNRHNLLANFKTLRDMIKGGREVDEILDSFKPDIVFGTGGYVTGNVVKEANKKGIRTYIHE
ncbi:MAG: glycosyltransferase, partial [Firmicutes bacterium]|nr:glycosyltransferase [Bacillota bacterium]